MNKKNIKYIQHQKGVTLLSLGITIVVLMILAGIVIAMLTSNNGIIKESTDTGIQTEVSNLRETMEFYIKNKQIERTSNNIMRKIPINEELDDYVTEVKTRDGKDLGVFYRFDGLDFSSKLGKGGSKVTDDWTGEMKELDDCFAIDFEI